MDIWIALRGDLVVIEQTDPFPAASIPRLWVLYADMDNTIGNSDNIMEDVSPGNAARLVLVSG